LCASLDGRWGERSELVEGCLGESGEDKGFLELV